MPTIVTRDGTEIYSKDWGSGPPVVFSHGWPLTADSWEAQMLFLAARGYRCIAHDRRGHGRSSQPWGGNEMDTYADDLAALLDTLWMQSMMAGHKNAYDCIKAFSETDFTEDLTKFDVPTLVLHGDDDQIVPIGRAARVSAALVPGAGLTVYPGAPHRITDTQRDQLNADLLAFFKE